MITLFEFRSSPYCEKARLVMDLKGLDYEAVEINGLDRAELKGISTYPTVPVIKDGDRVVEDSTDIVYYLDETYPDPPLMPSDPALKRQVKLWEDWSDESWGYDGRAIGLWALRNDMNRFRNEVTRKVPGPLVTMWPVVGPIVYQVAARQCGMTSKTEATRRKGLERGFALLAETLSESDWLVGDSMTLADVSVAAHLWELRHTDEFEKSEANAPVYALRDRVYEQAKASRVSAA